MSNYENIFFLLFLLYLRNRIFGEEVWCFRCNIEVKFKKITYLLSLNLLIFLNLVCFFLF